MVRCKITKCVATLTLLFIVPILTVSSPRVDGYSNNLNVVTNFVNRSGSATDAKQKIRKELVTEVANYISERCESNKHIASSFVKHGLSNDIDICFMLAQAEIETCIGKTGTGRSHKKSIFGVVSRQYSSYDQCINDYCSILKQSYLVNGKTEHHLMKNYITKGGYRYSSSRGYEAKLANVYQSITTTTKIKHLQLQYKSQT